MLQFLGDSKAEAAKQILAFEIRMATPRLDKVARRNSENRYNPKAITALQEMTPSVNWNTVWRTKMRDETLKNRIKTDPHSLGMYRAKQPLRNINAFYDAFEINDTNTMYLPPEDRVIIW